MARKRLIFFNRSYTFLRQIIQILLGYLYSFKINNFFFTKKLKTPTTYLLIFVTSCLLIQGIPILATAQTPTDLTEPGKALYEAGKYTEAVAILQQAIATYKTQGDSLKQAMGLSNLSLAYQQLGLWKEAESAISESLNLLKLNQSPDQTKIFAQSLEIKGRLQLSLGQAEAALNTWQQAANNYTKVGDQQGELKSRINQAQALQTLGFYSRALKTLTQVDQALEKQPDSLLKATALRSFGDILQLVGRSKEAEEKLTKSLEISQTLKSSNDIASAQFSLGNTSRTQQKKIDQKQQTALKYYQDAANLTTSPSLKIRAQINQLSLLVETQQWAEVKTLLPEIKSQFSKLSPNQTTVNARINLAQSLIKLPTPETQEAATQLSAAISLAKQIGDQRATAYAKGNLGALYEKTGQLNEAKKLTNEALVLAQTINASDIAYLWQWQLARILQAQSNKGATTPQLRQDSIAAYDAAVQTLQSLRGDLVSVNPDAQFSFRESVEPVYRQFVALLLQSQGTPENVERARNVIESLQQAELVNFFREDCLNGIPVKIDTVDKQAAVVYPIVLKDRLEVVVSLPNAPLQHYSTILPQAEIEEVFAQLRQAIAPNTVDPNSSIVVPRSLQGVLSPFIDPNRNDQALISIKPGLGTPSPETLNYLPLAQKVYNWLIRPAEAAIAASKTKTLVFVLDGPMLNLPMAVLNDGKQFLVEKYAIAYTPGLQLLDAKKPLPRSKLTALKGGLSKENQGFIALQNVEIELEQIKTTAKVGGEQLLNESFTNTALKKGIDSAPFPIVHLATHGQFSSNAEDTFILTWDSRLNVNELNTVLRSREESGKGAIELLVLSACQTATGDKRAALGLAGVAIKAGARSTVATLWFVSDPATAQLMTQFYQELADTTITKAEALKRAQVSLLKSSNFKKPIYWAPYVMIGNWL
jgi:CHAT domain-containing protein